MSLLGGELLFQELKAKLVVPVGIDLNLILADHYETDYV